MPTRSDLIPVSGKVGTGELMACLTLVSPSGMTAEDRLAWVAVAKSTLTGIPADLLARGCKKARATCRFPSDIVPTIVAEVKAEWDRREQMQRHDEMVWRNRNAPRLEQPKRPEPNHIPREETQRILREVARSMLS